MAINPLTLPPPRDLVDKLYGLYFLKRKVPRAYIPQNQEVQQDTMPKSSESVDTDSKETEERQA